MPLVCIQVEKLLTCAFTLHFCNARHRPTTWPSQAASPSWILHVSASQQRNAAMWCHAPWSPSHMSHGLCEMFLNRYQVPRTAQHVSNTSRDKCRLRGAYNENLPPSATWSMHASPTHSHVQKLCDLSLFMQTLFLKLLFVAECFTFIPNDKHDTQENRRHLFISELCFQC